MKKRHVLIIAIFLLPLSLTSYMNSYCIAQEDRTVTVEEGSFVFKNTSIEKYWLKGDVTNDTSKDWNNVVFEIDLYDAAGNKIKGYLGNTFKFDFYHLKKGETKSIGSGYGKLLLGIKGAVISRAVISRYELRFKTGDYPATYSFVITKPKANKTLSYEDRFVKIDFSITKKQFGFILQNRTDNPIIIDWNQVSYVDVLGESHKVMHSGIKYTDRAKPQPPTVLPPTAKLEDIVFPIDYVYYSSGKYGGWREISLFPEAPKAKIFQGRSFSVFMPLEINGVKKNFLFSFKIENVES
ncbi:MAG: hypothetical protein AVO38_11325 [delta proteobacterium ML8_D]|nr:MAG: hypothetical protein AVO38_11325 [delta proteobacterium ML8_D]